MLAAHYALTMRFSPLDDQTYRVQLAGPTSGDYAGTTLVISAGTQVVNLDFPGRSIHRFGIDGPYTLANVLLKDLSVGGVLADTANDAFVTAPYDHRQFGLHSDVDVSCEVDIEDIISIEDGCVPSVSDTNLDIHRDGVITIVDVMLATGNWETSCWE